MDNKLEELKNKIVDEFCAFKQDAHIQVSKGNKAAGARSRKSTLALTKLFKEWRKLSVAV